ncbi:MAG: glycosyltransferase family 2 protein, partial [Ignavibacteria bacterium]|nr:glycosyltransferase family 2 protein [Ignavibacteria bacterium]
MINKPKISVIIPVYNTERYLPKCVESILAQTFNNFELLLIDDGSSDNSGRICDKYAQEDSRIRVFHKTNGGVSSARNLGIDNAKGDYICFVDSDDFVLANYLKDLIEHCLPGEIGIVIQGYNRYNLHGKLIRIHKYPNELLKAGRFYLAFSDYKIFWSGGPVAKIFVTNVLNEKRIRFDSNIQLGEDLIFLLEYLKFADYIKLSESVNYQYMLNSFSSLSCRYSSFDTELFCYKRYLTVLYDCKIAFSIDEKYLVDAYSFGACLFLRPIHAMYRPPNFLEKRKRLLNLRSLKASDLEIFACYFKPSSIRDKIAKHLLTCGYFNLYDLFYEILFGFRYKLD